MINMLDISSNIWLKSIYNFLQILKNCIVLPESHTVCANVNIHGKGCGLKTSVFCTQFKS